MSGDVDLFVFAERLTSARMNEVSGAGPSAPSQGLCEAEEAEPSESGQIRVEKEFKRPRVTGRPLEPETNPTVPKPLSAIEIIEPDSGLRLEDRKLFNVLLALSWDQLIEPRGEEPFHAPAALLRRAIGQETATDNRRLRDSLKRLMRTLLTFPRVLDNGSVNEGVSPLLSMASLPKGQGIVEWEFSRFLKPHLAGPCIWARLHLNVCAAFSGKYALILYELLSIRAGLRFPVWEASVDELRRYLGVDDKLSGWDLLSRKAVIPGIEEINLHAPFTVKFEPVAERGSRRIVSVRFTIAMKHSTTGK